MLFLVSLHCLGSAHIWPPRFAFVSPSAGRVKTRSPRNIQAGSRKYIKLKEIDLWQHFMSLIQNSFAFSANMLSSFPLRLKPPEKKKKDIKLAKSSLLLCFPMKNVVHKSEQFCSNMFQLFRGIQISQPQTNTTSVTAAWRGKQAEEEEEKKSGITSNIMCVCMYHCSNFRCGITLNFPRWLFFFFCVSCFRWNGSRKKSISLS